MSLIKASKLALHVPQSPFQFAAALCRYTSCVTATNYILGFDPELKAEAHNFVHAIVAEAAKNGTLKDLVDQYFGKGG